MRCDAAGRLRRPMNVAALRNRLLISMLLGIIVFALLLAYGDFQAVVFAPRGREAVLALDRPAYGARTEHHVAPDQVSEQ